MILNLSCSSLIRKDQVSISKVDSTRYLESSVCLLSCVLHSQNRSGLCQYIDTIGTSEQSPPRRVASGVPEGTPPPFVGNCNKQDHKVRPENKVTSPSQECSQTAHVRLVNLLETTLWNRKLAPTSEEIVNALVTQIFEGIREHCVASAEMKVENLGYSLHPFWSILSIWRKKHISINDSKEPSSFIANYSRSFTACKIDMSILFCWNVQFNCFFLIPVVDKFPAVLREDLETAFQGDIENVFDVALVCQIPRLCLLVGVCFARVFTHVAPVTTHFLCWNSREFLYFCQFWANERAWLCSVGLVCKCTSAWMA